MIDRKVLDQLILSHQLLSKPLHQAPAAPEDSRPAQLMRDLIICRGAAELALAALCIQLDCVPDKREIGLTDYFESLRKTTHSAAALQGADYVAELQKVRSESQLRFHLPEPRRWARAKEETLEHVTSWCRQSLGLNLTDLASVVAPVLTSALNPSITSSSGAEAAVSERGAQLAHSSDITGPVKARYNCAGSADIRLPRWGHSEKGKIANLSVGGCNIKSNYAFEVGEDIEMILQVNKMSFRAAGSVIHVPLLDADGKTKASDLGIGVQFKNMTAGARDRLQELIAELKSNKVFRRHLVAN
jgi:Tfp pilus assembly protein PilZ